MIEQVDVFQGSEDDLLVVDIEGPLAHLTTCHGYDAASAFQSAAESADQEGVGPNAAVYRFLQAIFTLHPTFDTPEMPFGPMAVIQGKRSIIPGDFSDRDIGAISSLANRAAHPSLRSRLNDLLWVLRKEHKACAIAAKAYLELAQLSRSAGHPHDEVLDFQRALYLAARLGRKKDLFKSVVSCLELTLENGAALEDGYRSARLMELMIRTEIGDPSKVIPLIKSLAGKFADAQDFHKAQSYFEILGEWLHRIGDEEGAQASMRQAAELLAAEAERRTVAPENFLAGAALLSQAIESLRRAGGSPERVAALKQRLSEYQVKSMSEMKRMGTEIDVTDMVNDSRAHVRGRSFMDAVRRLAFGWPLTKIQKLRGEVEANSKKFVMTHLFGGVLVDHKGRPIARRKAIHGMSGETREQAIEEEMFEHASRYYWSIRVVSFIEPARQEILSEHHPSHQDLFELIQNNSFIPTGHEEIFLRGLYAGFHGDYLVASHLLVPQIENSIRSLLEARGVDVTNLHSDGTQPVKVLGTLLCLDATADMLGEEICFELRGIFVEKTGYDFRNRLAHGFLTAEGGQSVEAANAWWITLRLCMIGHLLTQPRSPAN